jgi:hypothetical protein
VTLVHATKYRSAADPIVLFVHGQPSRLARNLVVNSVRTRGYNAG